MKPLVLVILDGWGISDSPEEAAQANATIPFYTNLLKDYPHTLLECTGENVGLPEGTMGNSEVGHLNLGAGRIVYQDYARINASIKEGSFASNKALIHAMEEAKTNSGSLHLIGLLSDGGVHSHIEHLYALIEMGLSTCVEKIFIHPFLDGRDTPPRSGINYIEMLEQHLRDKPSVQIATVTGRYWALDRDERWERVERAFNALVNGEGRKVSSAREAVEKSYCSDVTDEFMEPSIIYNDDSPVGLIQDGDAVIFINFRADRAREITKTLTDPHFEGFPRQSIPKLSSFVTMTAYDDDFDFPVAFPPVKLTNILGEIVSRQKLKQLRIAETEKYAHVTYFFNGGAEEPFEGEDRCLIPSPKDVATYDLKPEMSAYEVTDEVLKRLGQNKYDFILLNYANPDMVGHTGKMEAAVKACETIDRCLQMLIENVLSLGGTAMITADHGNCDLMTSSDVPFTAHTMNPVPFIILRKGIRLREKGILADVAPTVLEVMGIPQPAEMTGVSLLVK